MKDTYYSRFLQSFLDPPRSEGEAGRVKRHVRLVLGARQTGKSTLLRHCARDGKSTLGKGYTISTWSTATGAEVDAIVETPDEAIPVEIKWTDRPSPRDAQHVETFIKLHSALSHRGYVVCRCRERQQLTDNVMAIPWNEF